MFDCDECKHKDNCTCVPYGCECFELDLEEHDKQIRAEAERDFQNSDYWNDYLAKVIADAKADAIEEIATRLEEDLMMVLPKDKVKYLMYKVHTVLEQLKSQDSK